MHALSPGWFSDQCAHLTYLSSSQLSNSQPAHILSKTLEQLLDPTVVWVPSKATGCYKREMGILGLGSRPGAGPSLAIQLCDFGQIA